MANNSKSWIQFVSKRAVTLVTVLAIIAVSLSTISYNVTTQQSSADQDIPNDFLLKDLVARPASAIACPPPKQQKYECKSGGGVAVYSPILSKVNGLLDSGSSQCAYEYADKNLPTDGTIPNKLPVGFSFTYGLASCTFDAATATPPENTVTLSGHTKLLITGGSFEQGLKTAELKNKGQQNLEMGGQAEADASVELKLADAAVMDYSVNPPKQKGTRKEWIVQGTQLTNQKGNFDGLFKYDLESEDDLTNDLYKYYEQNPDSDVVLDKAHSSWKILVEGFVDGALAMTWVGDKVTLTNLQFCPKYCEAKLTEEVIIEAQKLGKLDGIGGTVAKHEKIEQNAQGTGSGDIATGSVHWNNDLEVTKNYTKEIGYKLKDLVERTGANASWVYAENRTTHSRATPYQDTDLVIHEKRSRQIDYDGHYNTTIKGREVVTPYSGNAKYDITEHQARVDGAYFCPADPAYPRCREGSGSTSRTHPDVTLAYEGDYDKKDPEMLITEASPDEPAVQALVGMRRSPFYGDDEIQGIAGRYLTDYLQYPRELPGTFSIDDGRAGAVISKPVLELPKVIYLFKSWDSPDDDYLFKPSYEVIMKVLAQAKRMGVTVVEKDTSDLLSMVSAFQGVKDGSVVVNIGHGSPRGLVTISLVGDDVLPYQTIALILHQKHARLAMFAADSCYAAHAGDLSEVVIGSVGVGKGSPVGKGLGTLLQIGTNAFNLTEADVASALDQALKLSFRRCR